MPPAAKRSKLLPATWVLRTLASSWTDVPGIPGRGTGLPGGPAAFTGGSLGPLRRCRGWGDRALVWQVDGRLPTSPPPLPGRGGMSEAGEESEHLLEFSCIRRRNFPSSKGGLDLPQRGLLCAGGGAHCGGALPTGSVLASQKCPAFSAEEVKGQEPGVIAPAFPLVRCPGWEGGLRSEEVAFRRMAPGLPEPSQHP